MMPAATSEATSEGRGVHGVRNCAEVSVMYVDIFEYIYTIHKANNYNKFNKIIISTSINYNLNINFLIKKYVNYLISKFLDEKYEINLTKILSKKLIIYEYIIHNIDNIDHYNKNIYLQILFNSL